MRIESPVGCPSPVGDPVEEKTVAEGSTGLFMSILDCFRVLVSGPFPEGASSGETAAVAGKLADRDQAIPAEPSSLQTSSEAVGARPDVARGEDCRARQNLPEGSEGCAVPAVIASSGAPFNPAIPGLIGNGQPTPRISDDAAHQTAVTGHEALASTKAQTSADLELQAETRGLNLHTQAGRLFDDVRARGTEAENGEETASTADTSAERALMSADIDQGKEAASPQESAKAASGPVPHVAVQGSAMALVIDGCVLRPDNVSTSNGKPTDKSGVPAQPALGTFSNGETEPGVRFPAVSATAWMLQKSVSATRVSMSQTGGRTVKGTALPQSASLPEEQVAGTRVSDAAGGTGPATIADVDEHDAGSYVPAQRLTDKALPSMPGQEVGRQDIGKQADNRPAATDLKAEPRLQPQSESVTRATGPSKISTAPDPATSAADLEKIAAGRGRLREAFEGVTREPSAGSSLSAATRDAQVSLQAPTAIKDVKAPAFVFEVAERISTVVAGGRGEVTIQLKPDEFGRMNIVAESGASGILARITTESAGLKQYLESNLPVLQQALQDQGLKIERIDVLVQEDLSQQQSTSQWQHNFGHAPGGHDSDKRPGFSSAAAAQPGAPANEITLDAIILGALHPNSTFHTIA